MAVLAIDRDTEGERRESGRLRMQLLFDASSQAEYAAAGASGTHWGAQGIERAQKTASDAQWIAQGARRTGEATQGTE